MGAACCRPEKRCTAVTVPKISENHFYLKLQSELRSVLDHFPRELQSIVIEYFASARHVWSTTPIVSGDGYQEETILRNCVIYGDTVKWDCSTWGKIVSSRSLVDGPRRWKIAMEFSEMSPGWIAVGVTLHAQNTTNSEMFWHIGAADDVLAITAQHHSRYEQSIYIFRRNMKEGASLPEYRSRGPKTHVIITISDNNQFIRMRVPSNSPFHKDYEFVLPLQLPGPLVDLDFRPCVMLSGRVTASILSYSVPEDD